MKNGDGKPTVLLVDDDLLVASTLLEMLEFEGYRCFVTPTGAEAIVNISNHNLDAAVIDVHLPDMSGLALAHVIRMEQGPDLPIVVISGDGSLDVLNRLRESGVDYFFKKPFQPHVLMDWLHESLSQSSPHWR